MEYKHGQETKIHNMTTGSLVCARKYTYGRRDLMACHSLK